jgi:hypothetical protein
MKKSHLRRIIKEELKKLKIKEQTVTQALSVCGPDCQQIFPNCKHWLMGITQLAPFTSSNPAQPCQFINNKINQIQTNMSNINPNGPWYAQLNCKLQGFLHLHANNNC